MGLVLRAIGALLCLGAGLKILDLFDSWGEGVGWTLALIASSVEMVAGVGLMAGVWPSVFRPAAGLLFVLLSAVSMIGATRGVASCGCLGAVPMPPWVLMVVDLAAAVVLLWGPRASEKYRGRQFVGLDAACIGAFFMGTTIGSVAYPRHVNVTTPLSVELIQRSGEFEIDPHRFRGQPFFLAPFIHLDGDLMHGRWEVILTRPGCRKCDRMIRAEAGRPEGDERVAVVLPPRVGGDDRDWEMPEGAKAIRGELTPPDKRWIFVPPMVFHVVDGKVVDAR